jgi:multicomponent Na+:H+ antiporter subunit B
VMGSLVLLREAREKKKPLHRDAIDPQRDVSPGDALRVWTLGMIAPKVLFGVYVVIHGQQTPGGGFQGGVLLATAPLLIYLGVGFEVFKGVVSFRLVELAEAVGAAGFALIGLAGWATGQGFLANVLPLGKTGTLTSGGTIGLISVAVGLEVTAGFVLLLYAFLQELLADGENHS